MAIGYMDMYVMFFFTGYVLTTCFDVVWRVVVIFTMCTKSMARPYQNEKDTRNCNAPFWYREFIFIFEAIAHMLCIHAQSIQIQLAIHIYSCYLCHAECPFSAIFFCSFFPFLFFKEPHLLHIFIFIFI